MTDLVASYFSFTGRLSRGQYWKRNLKLVFYSLASCGFFLAIVIELFPLEIPIIAKLFGVAIIMTPLLSTFSLYVRRLHYRRKSGWWIFPFYIIPQINSAVDITLYNSLPLFAVSIAVSILGIWGFVETGFLRGRNEPNAYGDDPLAT